MRQLFLLLCSLFTFVCLKAQTTLPANMYADTAHAPFYYGVASGDPLTDRVILWTHYTADSFSAPAVTLNWAIATDTGFTNIVNNGTVTTDSTTDWTAKVDAGNLTAGTTYYYRFTDGQGNATVTGRTRTAPDGPKDNIKVAVASCSSIYSGFFNAYRRIGERDDLSLVIHLGDYIYDFVDEDEEVRLPTPYPDNPDDLAGIRDRHEYYLLDPDLRYARQMHPWALMWDNHDLGPDNERPFNTQAFLEWTPTRILDSTETNKIFRKLSYGDLLDVFMLDIMQYRDAELIDSNQYSILGSEQYAWFMDELANSTAQWKIVGSQKMFSYWGTNSFQGVMPTPGGVFSLSTWDGYTLARQRVLNAIDSMGIDNVIVISGDSHVSMATDLTRDPTGDQGEYNPATGDGALGVEFLPTSISRGNFDEAGVPGFVLDPLYDLNAEENPHHFYVEVVEHGYGELHLGTDSTVARFHYSPILSIAPTDTVGKELVLINGANHWKRPMPDSTVAVPTYPGEEHVNISPVYPNPVSNQLAIDIELNSSQQVRVDVMQYQSLRKMEMVGTEYVEAGTRHTYRYHTGTLPAGVYLIHLLGEDFNAVRLFVKQ